MSLFANIALGAYRKLTIVAGFSLCLTVLTGTGVGASEDIAGGKDHPLIGRYKDSSIVFYKAADFDELVFL